MARTASMKAKYAEELLELEKKYEEAETELQGLEKDKKVCIQLLSAAERRCTPVLLSALVSDNSANSPQMSGPRRSREIDQSMQRFSSCCN